MATIANNTIAGNSAGYDGGGLHLSYHSSPTIANNTITGNSAGENGGGVYMLASSPTIANTIVAFNSSGIRRYSTAYTPTLRYNCVYGNDQYDYSGLTDPTGADGNISADPLFVPGPGGCFYLSQTSAGQVVDSPCVDGGSDTAENLGLDDVTTCSNEQTDTGIVDMGYHYPVTGQTLIMGDFDRDGSVDLADFANWPHCMTGPGPTTVSPCCRIFDFEPDGDMDLADFAVFQLTFTGG